MIQKTLILIKPDGVARCLTGECLQRFEKVGLKLIGIKMIQASKDLLNQHYYDIGKRRGQDVKNRLLEYMTGGPIVAMVFEGVEAVEIARKLVGVTDPKTALPGTIRGDFTHLTMAYADSINQPLKNIIHASGNVKEAEQEINLWFKDHELCDYKTVHELLIQLK